MDVLRGFANPQEDSTGRENMEVEKDDLKKPYQMGSPTRKRQYIAVKTGEATERSELISDVIEPGKTFMTTTNFSEAIQDIKKELKTTQKEAMKEMRVQLINETVMAMKEMIKTYQAKFMHDVKELIREAMLPMTQVLTNLLKNIFTQTDTIRSDNNTNNRYTTAPIGAPGYND